MVAYLMTTVKRFGSALSPTYYILAFEQMPAHRPSIYITEIELQKMGYIVIPILKIVFNAQLFIMAYISGSRHMCIKICLVTSHASFGQHANGCELFSISLT